MFDTAALGELLIDFTPAGTSQYGNPLYERNPGGAPANVLAAMSKLGASTVFIGKVGDDQFGRFLEETLVKSGISVSGLKFSKDVNTTLAFVHLDPSGDRAFTFYRNPGADMMLEMGDIDGEIIKQSKVFHFGSISLISEPSRSATLHGISIARENGLIISYDPNLRPPLWESLDAAKKGITSGLKYADILKVSGEELEFITGVSDLEMGTSILQKMGISLILVTLGENGAFYRCGEKTGTGGAYSVKAIDTTGAGDAFLGGVLYRLKGSSLKEILSMSKEELEDVVDFGNAAGALTTARRGAIPAVPSLDEVLDCMKSRAK